MNLMNLFFLSMSLSLSLYIQPLAQLDWVQSGGKSQTRCRQRSDLAVATSRHREMLHSPGIKRKYLLALWNVWFELYKHENKIK